MRFPRFKTVSRWLLPVAMLFMVIGSNRSDRVDPEIPGISQRVNDFTIDLLKHQAKSEDFPTNSIFSPQSIFHGLAMSYIASDQDTREELRQVLHFPEQNQELLKDLADLRKQLHQADSKRIEMTMANSVWLDNTHADFRDEYVDQVQDAFGASLHQVTFAHKQRVSDDINKWVSQATRGKIQKSVAPSDFEPRSQLGIVDEPALVTVNAVYFKSDWSSRFDKASTQDRIFHTGKATTVETPMMHQQSLLPYFENDHLKFLELPYVDNHYSMYLILPREIVDIRQLIQTITSNQIVEMRQRAYRHKVDVLLPKFELRTHLGVKDALSAMGVRAAFSNRNADFDKMIIKKNDAFRIHISQIYHDAWIDVHEDGTKAAAATSTGHFSFGCSAAPLPMSVHFHADHPFLFMIVHNGSRSILFAGWISNPENSHPPDK